MEKKYILKYRIEGELGKGGMSRVYLGVEPVTGLRVAIKVLNQDLAEDASMRERFLVEAQSLAKLDHPDIVHLIEYDHEKLVLVQKYIEGMDLEEYITNHRGPIPEEEAKALFCKLLEAFAYVHQSGVIHRDIKPANIFMTKGNQVKIVDFGIAKDTETGRNTSTGTRMGTVAYMSPEQVLGEDLDKRTDIYSLGVLLHQMLTGKAPYDINTDKQFKVQAKIVQEPLPRMKSIYEYVSPGMQAVVDKATAKDRSKRYQSCEEFMQAVKAVKFVTPPVTGGLEGLRDIVRDKRVIAVMVVVLLVALGVFGFSRAPKRVEPPVEPPVVAVPFSSAPVVPDPDKAALREAERQRDAALRKADSLQKANQKADDALRAAQAKSTVARFKVGDREGGGVIFDVDVRRQRCLVAATKDMPGHSGNWAEGCFTWDDAMARCSDFRDQGYSDWYLPNKKELMKLYRNKSAVGGFSAYYYWSSSESGAVNAWYQYFGGGSQGVDGKDGRDWVRPVRAFTY